jgi:hypothetical protein
MEGASPDLGNQVRLNEHQLSAAAVASGHSRRRARMELRLALEERMPQPPRRVARDASGASQKGIGAYSALTFFARVTFGFGGASMVASGAAFLARGLAAVVLRFGLGLLPSRAARPHRARSWSRGGRCLGGRTDLGPRRALGLGRLDHGSLLGWRRHRSSVAGWGQQAGQQGRVGLGSGSASTLRAGAAARSSESQAGWCLGGPFRAALPPPAPTLALGPIALGFNPGLSPLPRPLRLRAWHFRRRVGVPLDPPGPGCWRSRRSDGFSDVWASPT